MITSFRLPTFPSLLTAPNAPFIHRDLSWLQFNERVLSEAEAAQNPLLERLKFLTITSTNLDEFFMIRYPSLVRSIQTAKRTDPQAAVRLVRIRDSILEAVRLFVEKQTAVLEVLAVELNQAGIHLNGKFLPDEEVHATTQSIFQKDILPKLPEAQKFSNSSLNSIENLGMAAILGSSSWIRIPKTIPLIFCRRNESSQLEAYFLDYILTRHLSVALNVKEPVLLTRLTRDGDFTVDLEEEDPESIPDVVRTGLRSREKGRPVRLQYLGEASPTFVQQMTSSLKLISEQVVSAPLTLCLSGMSGIQSQTPPAVIERFSLKYPAPASILPKPFRDPSTLFDRLDSHDLLLHHPYDSFDAFVSWIRAACTDPSVTQIDQTVYRVDTLSPIIEALKTAAKSKKVRVVIELRARFDELNNLRLAEELQQAGVQVTFGFGSLKLHSKVALVTRKVGAHTRLYAHLSTGNYNATTARQYTDLAILTSHPELCADAKYFFDQVCAGEVPKDFKRLVSAPTKLHRRLLNHIQSETEAAERGKKARIFAKVNALVDDLVIQHLYRASQAGVKVDLIVRGACSLVPGVKGLSENIRVISIVDRFLEHSRIYYFENAKTIYLSSADWMPRNFFSRLEVAFPVLDPQIYQTLEEYIIPVLLSDTGKAKELTPEGNWKSCRQDGNTPIRSQFLLEELATREYQGTPLWRRKNDSPLPEPQKQNFNPNPARTPGYEVPAER